MVDPHALPNSHQGLLIQARGYFIDLKFSLGGEQLFLAEVWKPF